MKIVYMPVFGSGLGHACRMALVAKGLLKEGRKIAFSSSYEAADYLRREGYVCYDVPGIDVGWGRKGGLSIDETVIKIPTNLASFFRQIGAEVLLMRRLSPELALSDSRLSAVVAASLLDIPSVVVLNQLRILMPRQHDTMAPSLAEDLGAEALGSLWSLAEAILLPDLPPPYTVAEKNLWGVRSAQRKARYVGFATPLPSTETSELRGISERLGLEGGKPLIFAHISGPSSTKEVLIRALLEVASRCSRYFSVVISEGDPRGDQEPIKIGGGWYYEWCPCKDELFALSDAVVIRGGHGAIAQSILFGKPMAIIPIDNHSEQASNAEKVSRLGAGIRLKQSELNLGGLKGAIEGLIEDGRYQGRALRLKEVALRFDGISNIIGCVHEYM